MVLLIAAAAAGAVVWGPRGLSLMRIGAGYGAKQVCSCVFVSGRPLEACRQDLLPLARRIVFTDAADGQVTASALGVVRATARFEEGFGCALVP